MERKGSEKIWGREGKDRGISMVKGGVVMIAITRTCVM